MGVFVERRRTAGIQEEQGTTVHGGRLLIAAGIVILLAVAGMVSEAQGWTESSKAIWGLAASAFGVIVGLLGGEAANS